MTQSSERFTEPWSTSLLRTVGLAVLIGVGVGLSRHRLMVIPVVTVLALWFTLGGHFVELLCRNELRPRLARQPVAFGARLGAWFLGGSILYAGALATNALLTGRTMPWPWWTGGVFFVGAELAIHSLLLVRRQPSVFDGRA